MSEANGETNVLRMHGAVKALAMSLVIALALSYIAIMVGVAPASNIPAHISYTSHATISINGNADFATQATANSWSGDGSSGNPYVIQGYDIDATSADGIYILNTNVHFTVRDCYIHDGGSSYMGIRLSICDNGILSNNTCSNNYNGIGLDISSHNTLNNNTCSNNVNGINLFLLSSNNNTLINNNCSNNDYGIWIMDSSHNNLTKNVCNSNIQEGIILFGSNNNLDDNTCSNNNVGVTVSQCSGNYLNNNACSNNHYGIYLEFASNNSLTDNDCSNNVDGVYLYLSNYISLLNNSCSYDTQRGIHLDSSSNNTISDNNCSDNWIGVWLDSSSNDNTLTDNDCSSNGYSGIYVVSSSNNGIVGNQLCDNLQSGLVIFDIASGNNNIWANGFAGNNGAGSVYNASHIQTSDSGTNNSWNSSSGSGKYWGDWLTPDNDANGIVDSPYNISGIAGAKDYFPLTLLTKASLSGTSGTNGWYRSNVSVSLTVTNAGYWVKATFYRISTTGSWSNYANSFILSSEGNSTIQFYSKDSAGFNESVREINIGIDSVAPMLTLTNSSSTISVNKTTLSWTGSDATSGIDHYEVKVGSAAFVSVGNVLSYQVTGLTDGTNTVIVKAVDKAGNSVNKTIYLTLSTGNDLILYIAIILIVILAVIVTIFIMMKKGYLAKIVNMMKKKP